MTPRMVGFERLAFLVQQELGQRRQFYSFIQSRHPFLMIQSKSLLAPSVLQKDHHHGDADAHHNGDDRNEECEILRFHMVNLVSESIWFAVWISASAGLW